MKEVTIKERLAHQGEPTPLETGPIPDRQRFESEAVNRISVTELLENPHPLVARSVIALRRAKPDYRGYLQAKAEFLDVQVTLDSSDRAMCIFDALLKALDVRGYPTTVRKNGERTVTSVRIMEEDVSIQLSEQVDRVERKADRKKKSFWSSVEYDWIPSGKLTLRIDSWTHGTRQTWSDGKQQRVETCLNQFIVALVVVAEQTRCRHLEWAEQERQRREAEERRLLQRRREEEEAAKVRALLHVVERWQTAGNVRRYVSEIRKVVSSMTEIPAEFGEWLQWADAFADRMDPLRSQPTIPVDPKPPERAHHDW